MAHLERVILLVMALEKASKAPEKKELEMMGLEKHGSGSGMGGFGLGLGIGMFGGGGVQQPQRGTTGS